MFKPQHPPTIELDGVRLRPLHMADAAALYAYLADPVVTELTSYPVVSAPMVEAMTSVDFPTGPGRSGACFRQGGQPEVGALARAQRVCARGLLEELSSVSWATTRLPHLQFVALGLGSRPTRRYSEREPADSLRDKFNVIGGWLPSLTFTFAATGDSAIAKS
jgi:hypothetical protein